MIIRNLNVALRATLSFAVITLLLLILGGFSLNQVDDLRTSEQEMELNWLQGIRDAGELDATVLRLRLRASRLLTAQDPEVQRATAESIVAGRAQLDAVFKRYEGGPIDDAERAILGTARNHADAYLKSLDKLLTLHAQQRIDEGLALANGEMLDVAQTFAKSVADLTRYNLDGAAAASAKATRLYRDSNRVIIGGMVVSLRQGGASLS